MAKKFTASSPPAAVYRIAYPPQLDIPIVVQDPSGATRRISSPWTFAQYLARAIEAHQPNAAWPRSEDAARARRKILDALGHVVLMANEYLVVRESIESAKWSAAGESAYIALAFAEAGWPRRVMDVEAGELDGTGACRFESDEAPLLPHGDVVSPAAGGGSEE